jgi:DNA (cytosine-5)-methyltransferase 1
VESFEILGARIEEKYGRSFNGDNREFQLFRSAVNKFNGMLKKRKKNNFTAVDLFSGAGGLTVGLKRAGFKVVAAVEVDAEINRTYKKNHPEVILINKDIRKVTGKEILKLAKVKKIDLVAGCPPCQGFSKLTDKHHRDDIRNELVLEMARIVVELKPKICMMENVPGLAGRGSPLLDVFEEKLISMRYKIKKDVLQMADFGVPQSRRRLVLLAGQRFEVSLPKATYSRLPDKDSELKPWVKLKEIIKGEPKPLTLSAARKNGGVHKFKWHVVRDIKEITVKRLKATKSGGNRLALPKRLRPGCHKAANTEGFGNVYGRMKWNYVAPTITSGCTTFSSGRFGHPRQNRTISVREAALIQTFPKSYKLETDNIGIACKLVGNALPCKFAEKVSDSCIAALSNR